MLPSLFDETLRLQAIRRVPLEGSAESNLAIVFKNVTVEPSQHHLVAPRSDTLPPSQIASFISVERPQHPSLVVKFLVAHRKLLSPLQVRRGELYAYHVEGRADELVSVYPDFGVSREVQVGLLLVHTMLLGEPPHHPDKGPV